MDRWKIIFLALLMAATSGYGGYELATHHDAIKINNLSSQIADLQKASPKAAKSNAATSKSASSFAEISPFKVRFPYGDSPPGLGYTDIDNDKVAFDSEHLSDYANKLDPKNTCGLEAAPGPLGFLTRTTNLPLLNASSNSDGLVAQVQGLYYVYTRPKDCSKNTQVISEQKNEVNLVIADLKKLQAD